MKRFRYIKLAGIVLIFTICACQDLEENPIRILVNESFFKTEADLDEAVTAAYYPEISNPWEGFCSLRIWAPLLGADDLACNYCSSMKDYIDFDRFQDPSQNFALLNGAWKYPFQIVRAANNVIENYIRIDGRESKINQSVAQAHFLRFDFLNRREKINELVLMLIIRVKNTLKINFRCPDFEF